MARNSTVLILTILIAAISYGRQTALPDGFGLSGIDGVLTVADANDKWLFVLNSEINFGKGHIPADANLELLASSALEKMIADSNGKNNAGYKLWGITTKYDSNNFIFPVYFLPLSNLKQAEPSVSDSKQQESRPAINESDDAFQIPDEIVSKLARPKRERLGKAEKGLELKANSVLAARVGIITELSDDQYEFSLDAPGRNLPTDSFKLLPCQWLERALNKQSLQLEQMRFKVSGIVTKYKGRQYLLLQRATEVYNYGNFGN